MSKRRLDETNEEIERLPEEDDTPVDSDGEDGEPEEKKPVEHDLFARHLEFLVDSPMLAQLQLPKKSRPTTKPKVPGFGSVTFYQGTCPDQIPLDTELCVEECAWIPKVAEHLGAILDADVDDEVPESEDDKTDSLVSLVARYVDVQCIPPARHHKLIYTAHALNHVIRTRNLILGNNKKLGEAAKCGEVPESLVESVRDQGFTRPTVLILCPMKKDAYEVVQNLKKLIFGPDAKKMDVMSSQRFEDEFSDGNQDGEVAMGRKKADEFKEVFTGNVDDCFRLGIAISKKSLKLFEAFERSDILLCSPLGMRMILDGDAGNDSHLLSSIQITVIDGADVCLQQNWENISLVFKSLYQQPAKITNDISRVRAPLLEGLGKFYAQMLLFSRHPHELMTAHMMQHSLNYRGLVVAQPPSPGTLTRIEIPLCQELHKVEVVADLADQATARFNYFKDNILPSLPQGTAVFIPSYFDFVRLRNHMKRDHASFGQCHEYAKEGKVARARDMFFHGDKNLLLITERFHFYKRYHIKGIKQLVFYQTPSHPSFYSDLINMGRPEGKRLKSVLLFTKLDRIRMQATFGNQMAASILASDKKIQAIVSE